MLIFHKEKQPHMTTAGTSSIFAVWVSYRQKTQPPLIPQKPRGNGFSLWAVLTNQNNNVLGVFRESVESLPVKNPTYSSGCCLQRWSSFFIPLKHAKEIQPWVCTQLWLGFTVLGMPLVNVPLLQQWFHAAALLLRVIPSGMSRPMLMSKQLLEEAVLEASEWRGRSVRADLDGTMDGETWCVSPRELGRLFLSC